MDWGGLENVSAKVLPREEVLKGKANRTANNLFSNLNILLGWWSSIWSYAFSLKAVHFFATKIKSNPIGKKRFFYYGMGPPKEALTNQGIKVQLLQVEITQRNRNDHFRLILLQKNQKTFL